MGDWEACMNRGCLCQAKRFDWTVKNVLEFQNVEMKLIRRPFGLNYVTFLF
jgi:hypothetical protein